MSEPSGDPPESKPPATPKSPAEAPGQNLVKSPRANPPSVFNPRTATPPALDGAPPGMAEFMAWMKALGGTSPEEESTPPGRVLIPKGQKKFTRQTPEGAKSPPPAESPSTASTVESGTAVTPEAAAPAAVSSRLLPPERFPVERKRRAKEPAPKSATSVLLTQLLVFALLLGSFFLGRITVPRSASIPASASAVAANASAKKGPAVLPPELAAKVAQSIAAEKQGDYQAARTLLESVQRDGGWFDGLTFHLAELAYAQRDLPGVLPLLNLSISGGEKVADCYNLRGTLLGQTDGPAKGLIDLETAAALDPLNAQFAFFVGEAQRRAGQPQAAIASLREALNRLDDPTQESFYALKLRLAQIEADQDKQFADELAAKLALNPPPLDWLFTAAAVELHRGDLSAAASYLDKAKAVASPGEMATRLRDYYFYTFADKKELAWFFQSIDKPASPVAKASPIPAAKAGALAIPTP